jgi:hypothetical protein
VIRRATTSVDPLTITNLIAIAAIAGGWGPYRPDQIEKALTTAFTGSRVAALESVRLGGRGLAQARGLLQELTGGEGLATGTLLGAIHHRGFAWGVGDRN